MNTSVDMSAMSEDKPSRLVVASLIWLSLLGAFIANIQPVFLGALSEAFALNARQLGFLGGAELGGACLASLLAPLWFPKFNLRKVAVFAVFALVSGNLLTTWVSNYSLLLGIRFCCGLLGSGVIYAMSLGLIGQLPNPERLIAIVIMCQVASLALGMAVIPVLLQYWQLPGMTLALTMLFFTGLLLVTRIPEHPAHCGDAPNDVPAAVGIRFLPSALLVSLLLFSMGLGGVWAFLERIGNSAGFAMIDIGNALAFAGFMGGAGALVAAILGLRFGRLLPLVAGLGGQVAVCLLLASQSEWHSYLIGVSLFNFFWNLVLPYLLGAIASADNTGRFMVLVPAAQGGGLAIGPVLAGLFIVDDAYATSGLVSMVLFSLCLILVMPLIRRLS